YTNHPDLHYFPTRRSSDLGDIAQRVNQSSKRRPWTFLTATVRGLLEHDPLPMQVALDGKPWFDGRAYLVAVANGTTFGRGMKIRSEEHTSELQSRENLVCR